MVSKNTAEKIRDICTEIEDCKYAIDALKSEETLKPEQPMITVLVPPTDEGVSVSLSHSLAIEILEKQLKTFEAEYKAFNDDALTEAKQ